MSWRPRASNTSCTTQRVQRRVERDRPHRPHGIGEPQVARVRAAERGAPRRAASSGCASSSSSQSDSGMRFCSAPSTLRRVVRGGRAETVALLRRRGVDVRARVGARASRRRASPRTRGSRCVRGRRARASPTGPQSITTWSRSPREDVHAAVGKTTPPHGAAAACRRRRRASQRAFRRGPAEADERRQRRWSFTSCPPSGSARAVVGVAPERRAPVRVEDGLGEARHRLQPLSIRRRHGSPCCSR